MPARSTTTSAALLLASVCAPVSLATPAQAADGLRQPPTTETSASIDFAPPAARIPSGALAGHAAGQFDGQFAGALVGVIALAGVAGTVVIRRPRARHI